ncbi:MAG TPA: hypothetical protein VFS67_15315 [Polyangiaceae bacterium]|jgi:hypothetical protein|nr:hypothetical protein [Polyangiaceae bacterium]
MRGTLLLVLAATLFGCGSNDDDSTTEESNTSASLPDDSDDCTGTLTGGPHPGALSCNVRVSYAAEPGVASSESDVTILTVQGSLKDGAGSFSQNLVFHGRASVQTYDDLVYEERQGITKKGTTGSVSFKDSNASSLFSADRASVSITALTPDPSVPSINRLSGSAEWDLSYLSSSMVDASIAITFEQQ